MLLLIGTICVCSISENIDFRLRVLYNRDMNGYYNVFLDNKYTRWYLKLMERRRANPAGRSHAAETHHILPRSFFKLKQFNRNGIVVGDGWLSGDPDHWYNLVVLTRREHYVAHLLLVRMTQGLAQHKMRCAYKTMRFRNRKNGFNSRSYVKRREELRKLQKQQQQELRAIRQEEERLRIIENKRRVKEESYIKWMRRKGILLIIGNERII